MIQTIVLLNIDLISLFPAYNVTVNKLKINNKGNLSPYSPAGSNDRLNWANPSMYNDCTV